MWWNAQRANAVTGGIWLIGLPLEEWLWIAGVTLMFALLTIVLVERQAAR